AWIPVPFTYPPEPLGGVMVSGFGGPQRPAVVPEGAAQAIARSHPDLVAAVTPTGRWWRDAAGFTRKLVDHVRQIADVCRLAMELEPELRVLCVDFMSSDIAGHVGWHRLDSSHPAHDPRNAGDDLIEVYE